MSLRPPSRLKTLGLALTLTGVVFVPAVTRAQNAGAGAAGATSQNLIPDTGARPVPRELVNQPFHQTLAERPQLLPVYFPATPPVLGAELPPPPTIRDRLWADLIPHTNELFFAPLSTRLSENDLNRRLRQRCDAYGTTRAAALAELLAALESNQPDADAQRTTLAQLARKQEPLLRELIATANTLRRDLYNGGLLTSSGDWNQHRNWRLGEDGSKRTPQELLYDEFSVLRAAIFYQEGLSPEQRQLLREITIELAEALGDRESTPLGEQFEPEQVLFFLPHGARLRLPGNLPPDLASEIAAFTAGKSALKRELREALFTLDREGDAKRERTLQELAVRQAPVFARLEVQAERIRPALAAVLDVAQSAARPGLPAALAARIEAYLREKADLQRAAQRQAEEPVPENSARNQKATDPRKALAAFEEQNRTRFAALATEARAIREEVARHAAAHGETPAKSVESLLADFMTAFKQQQLQSLYHYYRTAVLQPGLSSAQRQLLFDHAIASLDLPGVKDWQAVPE